MLGGAQSRNVPETTDILFEIMPLTASLSSLICLACSRTSAPSSVSRKLRVDRSSGERRVDPRVRQCGG